MRDVLVVELLGGFGDLLLALPAVHALARSHPGARVHVATFAPGGELLARDPLVASVSTTSDHTEGAPRRFVEGLLDTRTYDLAVTTTTYDGIGDLLRSRVPRTAVDLWRRPPADELVDARFLRLLAADGLVRPDLVGVAPRLALDPAEVAAGHALLPDAPPVLLLPDAGMPIKRWAGWPALVRGLADLDVVAVPGPDGTGAARATGARLLPALGLRALAGHEAHAEDGHDDQEEGADSELTRAGLEHGSRLGGDA